MNRRDAHRILEYAEKNGLMHSSLLDVVALMEKSYNQPINK